MENTNNTAPQTSNHGAMVSSDNMQLGGDIWSNAQSFEMALRMAKALAGSTIIPKDYQGNVSNTLIALELAGRMDTSPMQVMQNLYVVNGRPAWSSQYIIAVINASRKYKHELKFDISGAGDTLSCYAWTVDANGERIEGPLITMKMAQDEGWVNRNGSKWKTMPEVMIRYRAASFFGRLYCSDMIMGIYSREEIIELNEDDYVIVSAQEHAEETIAQNANATMIDAGAVTQPDAPVDDQATDPSAEDASEVVNPEDPTDEDGQISFAKELHDPGF